VQPPDPVKKNHWQCGVGLQRHCVAAGRFIPLHFVNNQKVRIAGFDGVRQLGAILFRYQATMRK
jgi:hypothetical protein